MEDEHQEFYCRYYVDKADKGEEGPVEHTAVVQLPGWEKKTVGNLRGAIWNELKDEFKDVHGMRLFQNLMKLWLFEEKSEESRALKEEDELGSVFGYAAKKRKTSETAKVSTSEAAEGDTLKKRNKVFVTPVEAKNYNTAFACSGKGSSCKKPIECLKELLEQKQPRPKFSEEHCRLYNLSSESQEEVLALYDKDFLTLADLKNFRKTIEYKNPTEAMVKHEEALIRRAKTDQEKAEMLRLRLGGTILQLHFNVMEYFSGWDESALAQCTLFVDVSLLSIYGAKSSPPLLYKFVGRRGFLELYREVEKLLSEKRKGYELLYTGTAGSGKSYIFATVSARLYSTGRYRVLYLIADLLLPNKAFEVIKHGLLLTFADNGSKQLEIVHLSSHEQLSVWCRQQDETIAVFVDDWNSLESEKSVLAEPTADSRNVARELILDCFDCQHILLKCASLRSNTIKQFQLKRKDRIRLLFHGQAYIADELQCILGTETSKLKIDSMDLEYYTGFMPRLVSHYVGSNSISNLPVLYSEYTRGIEKALGLPTSDDDVERILAGAYSFTDMASSENLALWGFVTCVNEDQKVRMSSQFLADFTYRKLMERQKLSLRKANFLTIEVWDAAIRSDLEAETYNPARVGWNVEALVIGVIQMVNLKKHGMEFHQIQYYGEAGLETKNAVALEKFENGVLFVPKAFNEHCVDLVYVKKNAENDLHQWTVAGIQISIASWESKKVKKSEDVWASPNMLRKWVPRNCKTISASYVYVMQQSQLQDAFTLEEHRKRIRSGEKITQCDVTEWWLSFGQIHEQLKFLDEVKGITEPKIPVKEDLIRCPKITLKGHQCKNMIVSTKGACGSHKPKI